jgi:CrcB protein
MFPYLLVMLGGALGAGFRYRVSQFALSVAGPGLPIGTWVINLTGGFLMGVLAGVLARGGMRDEPLRLFLGVGVLGGFTTFSAFSLEMFNMLARNELAIAAAYAVSSVAGSILALFLGVMLVRMVS